MRTFAQIQDAARRKGWEIEVAKHGYDDERPDGRAVWVYMNQLGGVYSPGYTYDNGRGTVCHWGPDFKTARYFATRVFEQCSDLDDVLASL